MEGELDGLFVASPCLPDDDRRSDLGSDDELGLERLIFHVITATEAGRGRGIRCCRCPSPRHGATGADVMAASKARPSRRWTRSHDDRARSVGNIAMIRSRPIA